MPVVSAKAPHLPAGDSEAWRDTARAAPASIPRRNRNPVTREGPKGDPRRTFVPLTVCGRAICTG